MRMVIIAFPPIPDEASEGMNVTSEALHSLLSWMLPKKMRYASESHFGSLTDEQMKRYEKQFHDPQLFLNTPAGIMVMHCSPEQYDRILSERSARKPREENVR